MEGPDAWQGRRSGRGMQRGGGRGRGRGRGRGKRPDDTTVFKEREETINVPKQSNVYERRRYLTDGAEELCELHANGFCGVLVCSRLHSPKRAPYVWQHRRWTEEWKLFSNIAMEKLEEDFCGNLDHTTTQIKRSGIEISGVPVNFSELANPQSATYETSIRRLSTRSYVEAGHDDISLYTQWIWYWKENNSEWKPFQPPELQATLETKYLGGQDSYHYDIGEHSYRLDFNRMIQRNLKYQTERSVHRRPAFFTLEDIRCGKRTCSSLLMLPPSSVVDIPILWSPTDFYQSCEKVELDRGSEFTSVTTMFSKTMSGGKYNVDNVFRIQNQVLWHSFCSMKKTMQLTHGKDALDERQLFHGTDSLDVINNICINNFDFRVSGKNATVYGQGAYFARDASYSHHYTAGSVRYMFMARVLVGCFTQGNTDYTRPPPRKGHILFDSCVNNITDPSIFVIFERNQCYPEYLIQYTDPSYIATTKKQANVTTQSVHSVAASTRKPPKHPVASTSSVPGHSGRLQMKTTAPQSSPVPRVRTGHSPDIDKLSSVAQLRRGLKTAFRATATNQTSDNVSSTGTTSSAASRPTNMPVIRGTLKQSTTMNDQNDGDKITRTSSRKPSSDTTSTAITTNQTSDNVSSTGTTSSAASRPTNMPVIRGTLKQSTTMNDHNDGDKITRTSLRKPSSDSTSTAITTNQTSDNVSSTGITSSAASRPPNKLVIKGTPKQATGIVDQNDSNKITLTGSGNTLGRGRGRGITTRHMPTVHQYPVHITSVPHALAYSWSTLDSSKSQTIASVPDSSSIITKDSTQTPVKSRKSCTVS